MAAKSAAQEEFDNIFSASNQEPKIHPEDRHDNEGPEEVDEETSYRQGNIDEIMRNPVSNRTMTLRLPPPSFDSGRTTGVKGVIADARSFEQSKKESGRIGKYTSEKENQPLRQSRKEKHYSQEGESFLHEGGDDEELLEQWREARRREIMKEGNDIRNRRTSPSMRRYGRFDEVDAIGYLDAIERVGKDTTVVVFVYDAESAVSDVIEEALTKLVPSNPLIHFVKVSYDEIEFDNAGVPAILAYRNQGQDLFANLTYVIDQIPEDTIFDHHALKDVLRRHNVL